MKEFNHGLTLMNTDEDKRGKSMKQFGLSGWQHVRKRMGLRMN
jgi:hypothetical protein